MLIIGCDYHPSVQQIEGVDTETGECVEKRLMHSDGPTGVPRRFYPHSYLDSFLLQCVCVSQFLVGFS